MRLLILGASALLVASSAGARAQSGGGLIGFAPSAFAQAWTSLPTDHFEAAASSSAPVRIHPSCAAVTPDGLADELVKGAMADAEDGQTRRAIALNEMMTSWPQEQRTAFQKLRDAEAAYAAGDEQRTQRFVGLLTRVVDGTGRSAAVDGSASAALDAAYAAALSREDEDARAKTEATHKAFIAYRSAFAAFADGQSLGTGMSVAAELDRQRAADLGADSR